MNRKIIVGVSGGIDSVLAALRLREEGWGVIAVHLVMRDCQSGEDAAWFDELNDRLGIPVISVDCRERFERCVIEPFVAAYKRGETPNPCVNCNETLKFRVLFEQAERFGAAHVATGHYARLASYRGKAALARSLSHKDQTYMLHRLPQSWLERLVLPLGDIRDKREVREELACFSFSGAYAAAESQDICFLAGESLQEFLKSHIPEHERLPGRMKDESGRDLGPHKGLIFYTEGQRKGLGLSCGPWFVEGRNISSGELRLRRGSEPRCLRIGFDRAVWQHDATDARDLRVQYCYRFPPVRAAALTRGAYEDTGAVELATPAVGVSLGQSLVFYDGNILLGGGVIIGAE